MKVAVISACFGDYDVIKPPVEQTYVGELQWLMVTDDPNLDAPGWEVIYEKRPHVHTNVAAKIPKLFPHKYTDADITIWMDASAIIQSTMVSYIVGELVVDSLAEEPTGWVMFAHPNRDTISDEVVASRGLCKYDDMDLEGQIAHYLADGYPDGDSLWATGIMGRTKKNIERDTGIGESWLAEIVRWSFQDQLSFSYVLWKKGFKPTPFKHNLWYSPFIYFSGHKS